MSGAVEIARFRVEPEAEEALVAAWPAMVDAMKQGNPSLETVRLVRFEDGSWADVAVWSDRDAAEVACGLEPPPEVLAFFEHIAEDISMDLVPVVAER